MQTSLLAIAKKAQEKKDLRFFNLYRLIDETLLLDCWRDIRKKAAYGVDGISAREYGENLTENVRNLALLDVYGRVAGLLLDLAVERDGRLMIIEKLSQKDIADRVGASREMISRIFKDLVAGGYVEIQQRRITINRDLPPHW